MDLNKGVVADRLAGFGRNGVRRFLGWGGWILAGEG